MDRDRPHSSIPASAPASWVREADHDSSPRTPRLADRYEIVSLVGAGSMGSVYRARDVELDEEIALKILRPDLASAPGLVELFRREVKLSRRITHPNVARMFDFGQTEQTKFLTMEYVDGPSLVAHFDKGRGMSATRLVAIARAIASGLSAAHAAGVIHRDLKPENVLIASDGRVVVTDFGIARVVERVGESSDPVLSLLGSHAPQAPLGSPAYMSPEQVEGRDADAQSDVYSLGVLMFEGLAGHLPFTGTSFLSLASARLTRPAPDLGLLRPDLPPKLAEIVARCLARRPEDRFASALELLEALATLGPRETLVPRSGAVRVASDEETAKSLAVLPFLPGGRSELPPSLEAVWDDVIDTLATTRGLRVRPRSAVQRFDERKRDPVGAGREVSVDVVVDAVAYADDAGAHVIARLVSVADGFQLWSRRFGQRDGDTLALGRRIAESIAEALAVEVSAHSPTPDLRPETASLYHEARRAERRGFATGFIPAVAIYRKLLAQAPDDAVVLAGFATSNLWAWFYAEPGSDRCRLDAENAIERAMIVAPQSFEVRLVRAQWLWNTSRLREAGQELLAARDLGTSLVLHEGMGSLLREVGLVEPARLELGRALRIDPESLVANLELARLSALEGDWEGADRFLVRVTSPTDPSLVGSRRRFALRMALWRCDFDSVRALAAEGEPKLQALDAIFRLVLEPDGKVEIQRRFNEADRREGCVRAIGMLRQIEAEIACMLGDLEWALLSVSRALEAGLADAGWLTRCPVLELVRSDPRAAKLVARVEARAAEVREVYKAAELGRGDRAEGHRAISEGTRR